ncbi:MAG: hypothetical protein NC206_06105 [Bacteroides sp.]|nr:hypothetical protein [Roseburia sp.]MCM1346640.1 hypothetical protein [Bacteroides sp.]MCM1420033.1 hypothetical protein [Bacteroides sp.]
MKTKLINIVAITAATMAVASCSEDNATAVSPVFKELTIAPQPVYTGQYAYAKVGYTYPGAYIYSSEYSYSVDNGASGTWTVVDPTTAEPQFKFQVPDNPGTYNVTFRATRINFSATDANGAVYGSANSVTSRVRVLTADVINACWGDTRVHIDSVLNVKDTLDGKKLWTGSITLSNADDAQALSASRIYSFDTGNRLIKVEETAKYNLEWTRQYSEALEGYKYDSLQNYTALSSMIGLTNINGYTKNESSVVLTGKGSEMYPANQWGRFETPQERANVVNAFWSGLLEKYTCTLQSEKTTCIATIYSEGDKLILNRVYTEKVD